MESGFYAVKVRFAGRRQWLFLSRSGCTNRIAAVRRYATYEEAKGIAGRVRAFNMNAETKVVLISEGGGQEQKPMDRSD